MAAVRKAVFPTEILNETGHFRIINMTDIREQMVLNLILES